MTRVEKQSFGPYYTDATVMCPLLVVRYSSVIKDAT